MIIFFCVLFLEMEVDHQLLGLDGPLELLKVQSSIFVLVNLFKSPIDNLSDLGLGVLLSLDSESVLEDLVELVLVQESVLVDIVRIEHQLQSVLF